jgi:hypothetical protein
MVGKYMKSHPAFKEILGLFPESDHEVLEKWIDKWFILLEKNQSVVNKKFINSPYDDFIKTQVAHNLVDKLIEKMVEYKTDENSYTASLIGLRRRKAHERNREET